MQHMNALSRLAGEIDEPLRRQQRGGLVAPHRMRARIALDTQISAIVETVFVFGVKRRAAADCLENLS